MLHQSSWLHVVWCIETYVTQKYNTYNGLAGHVQYGWCVDVLKASFVRVQCDSSQLSISLSQVTVSREKRCSGNKAAPRPSRTLPITRPPRGKPSRSWLMTTVLWPGLKRATVLPIALFRLACGWCQRAQRLRHDSGVMALLSRCDNKPDSCCLFAVETWRSLRLFLIKSCFNLWVCRVRRLEKQLQD